MATRALDLFKAYAQDKLPKEGGYIVSSFFQEASAYAKYEVVAYSAVKAIYLTQEGLTFQSDGNKLFVLSEPANYHRKHMEPFTRDSRHQIPHRFGELEVVTAKNQTRIMISKDPVLSYASFTVLKPTGINFAFIFYKLPDVLETILHFFEKTLNQEAGVPKSDATAAARKIVEGIDRFTIWQDTEGQL